MVRILQMGLFIKNTNSVYSCFNLCFPMKMQFLRNQFVDGQLGGRGDTSHCKVTGVRH